EDRPRFTGITCRRPWQVPRTDRCWLAILSCITRPQVERFQSCALTRCSPANELNPCRFFAGLRRSPLHGRDGAAESPGGDDVLAAADTLFSLKRAGAYVKTGGALTVSCQCRPSLEFDAADAFVCRSLRQPLKGRLWP